MRRVDRLTLYTCWGLLIRLVVHEDGLRAFVSVGFAMVMAELLVRFLGRPAVSTRDR